MIVYHAPTAPAGSRWQPTQGKASAQHVPFEQRTVAENGRQGICDLLNASELHTFGCGAGLGVEVEGARELTREEIVNSNTPEAQAAAKELMNPDRERSFTATEIEDFILNRASVAQVENILGCIGTRFAELAKGARA